jgi:hypothetical protein
MRTRDPAQQMTFRDSWDVVHYIHATHDDTLETLCFRHMLYGDTHHVPSNAELSPPTCLFCISDTSKRWIRPPFGLDDPRYQDLVVRALSA